MARRIPQRAETQEWLVPVHNAVLVVEEAVRQGVDKHELVRGTGFSLKDLESSDTLKSYAQVVQLIERALELCPYPGLGLRIGREESPAQWGILGFATMCCQTLRDMIGMVIKYHRIAASMAEFYFWEKDDLAVIEVRPPRALHAALPTVVEEHLSATWSVARLLTGRKDLRPSQVNVSYTPPRYARLYRDVFGCPVNFSQASNCLMFERKWLKLPIMHSSALSSQMAERICALQLRRQYVEDDLVHKVRYLLLAHTETFPDAEQVAESLSITSRTLRNRLRAESTSFQSILDDVRHQLAVTYLEESELPLGDISELLGFNDVSNFRRAFKKWTGKCPSKVRASRAPALQKRPTPLLSKSDLGLTRH
jgi:AraC-type DNA-binding domain-containing proteins